ncbi:hypothetical protein N7G274_006017 [Stereocaulon virgatum]|uniref:AHC1-like C2H2 zinc-finger domain-containing protein n=1 Tax=Stereocaulon virgatum TaxID=373712 RepID=A0ABR4A7N8_9LECA
MLSTSNGLKWFSWSSSGRSEDILQGKANYVQTKHQRPPVTQIPLLHKMKRKRGDSRPDSPRLGSPAPKRRTETMSHIQAPAAEGQGVSLPPQVNPMNELEVPSQTEIPVNQAMDGTQSEGAQDQISSHDPSTLSRPSGSASEGGEASVRRRVTSLADLRDTFESHFGLEILLKHKELRLIDQEFAKCQAALEQLRRCQIIPYPAMSSVVGDMQAASSGSGAAFNNRAPYASPWGVTTGPYSRHYERWLIPDSAFDENFIDLPTPTFGGKTVPDRATRGSKAEKGVVGSKSRSQRGSTSARLQALPHGYPEPKEEKGPMIVKRSSDGKMVKLVCLDCRRSNFNSAQGFINHCRIAHSRQFLSHDAAIEASGEAIDAVTEAGLGEIHGSQATASAGLVHPLIRFAHNLARNTPTEPTTSTPKRKKSQPAATGSSQPSVTPTTAQAMPNQPPAVGPGQFDGSQGEPVPLNPSPQAPNLSAYLARMGRGGDLNELVTEATMKPEIDLTLSSDEDEEEMDITTQQPGAPQSRSTRGVLRGGGYSGRATRSPSPVEQTPIHPARLSAPSQRPPYLPNIIQQVPYPSPYQSDQEQQHNHHTPLLEHQSPFNLSPNTIASHTAPSLVSDDGDYENTHSESESPSSAEADDDEDHYIHAEVMDHDDMDLGEGSSAQDHHLGLGKPHGASARRRSSAIRPPTPIHNGASGERHVSFASPQRRLRRASRTKDGH